MNVKELISYHSGVPIENINEDTFIEDDLGTMGDDAKELIEAIKNEYQVDFSEFDFSLHFFPEAGSNVSPEYGYYPITVKHIIEVVEQRKWKLPPKNNHNYQKYVVKKRIKKLLILVCVFLMVAWIYYFLYVE